MKTIKVKGVVIPSFLSNKQVSEKLGITRQNMPNKRKSKGFPKPFIMIDTFPLWLESDIDAWLQAKEEKRDAK